LWAEGKNFNSIFLTIVTDVRLADMVPGADAYKPIHTTQKPSRFNDTHLGTDVKTCEKMIKYTPGPGHYNNDSTRGRTFNYKARNGPYKGINQIIAVTTDQSISPRPDCDDSINTPRGHS